MSSSSSSLPQETDAKTNEELYQEMTNLASSWPCFPTFSSHPLYRHEHGWYSSLLPMVGAMVADACFKPRASDIVIATLPKCGTTWMKALVFSTAHRREHPADAPDHPLNHLNPHKCIQYLEYQLYTGNKIPDLDQLPDPRLFATHVPYVSLPGAGACKVVYVCRDPKDALVSLWKFGNKFRVRDGQQPLSIQTAVDFFCDGISVSGPYWDHVLGYWRAHLANPDQVLFFRYEEMTQDPAAHVRRLAEFMGRPFGVDEEEAGAVDAIVRLCSFQHMSGLQVNKSGSTDLVFGAMDNSFLFRRGMVGDWENHLSPEMAQKIDAITKAMFEGSGLRV